MALIIKQFLIGSDNLGVLLHNPETGMTASIDAGDAGAIEAALTESNWKLTHILITHHHDDHIAGIERLKERYHAYVYASALDEHRIPFVDEFVFEGDEVWFGDILFDVIETPGHTNGHIDYYCQQENLVFTGDTLFSLGCGRLFEGTAAEMWASLGKLGFLPDETQVYCGHEYTLANARFAVGVDPENAALVARIAEVETLRAQGAFTLPTTIGAEKATNPFMRAAQPEIAAAMGLTGASPVDVLAALREAKNKA